MKSFGLWYLMRDGVPENTSPELAESEILPKFDLHVNFWSLEDYSHIESADIPCLDIGIKIKEYELIDKLTFFCPFLVDKHDIKDLTEKITTKKNASIVFNADCEIFTKDSYTIIEFEKEQLLLFPLDQVVQNVYNVNQGEYGTKLEFHINHFLTYIKSNRQLSKFNTIYIRFRIVANSLRDNIYFDSEPLNKSFESAFSGTRMIDFKINEKRNIEEKVRAEVIVNHEKMADFERVHFLVMEPSAYEVKSFDALEMSCRELEKGLWDEYLGTVINFSKGHILAYHWKQKNKKNDFKCLVKVNYSKTRAFTMFVYAMIVVALGMVSGALVNIISVLNTNDWKSMVVTVGGALTFVLIGIFAGKKF